MFSIEVIAMIKTKPILAFLESAWLKQLSSEFESMCYQYRLKLHKPVFEIRDMKSQWGQWDPLTRTLTLSRFLIQQHSWQHVLGVLKHEMAHMVVTEVFSGDSSHGPDFQRACDLLGVPDEYRGAGLDLGEPLRTWQETVHVPEEDAIILRKVEKLLAMAESSNLSCHGSGAGTHPQVQFGTSSESAEESLCFFNSQSPQTKSRSVAKDDRRYPHRILFRRYCFF
jgi:hypothetical protein